MSEEYPGFEQTRLARTYFTDEVDKLPFMQLQVYIVQYAQLLLVYLHVFISYQRFVHNNLVFLPARTVAFFQLTCQIFYAITLRGQQYDEVVQQIGSFVYQTLVGAVARFNDGLNRFFTYFLRHFIDTRPEQAGCVRAFRHFGVTLVDEVLKKFQEHNGLFVLLAPASVRTRMANRTDRVYLNQQSILVAVLFHGNHVQEVAALLAFRVCK